MGMRRRPSLLLPPPSGMSVALTKSPSFWMPRIIVAMSHGTGRPDPIAKIRSAGKVIATGGHNADMCVRAELFGNEVPGNVGTPSHTKKFRRTTAQEVGLKQ